MKKEIVALMFSGFYLVAVALSPLIVTDRSALEGSVDLSSEVRARYLAESGYALAAAELSENSSRLLPENGKTVTATYSFDGIDCVVVISRSEALLELSSSVQLNGSTGSYSGSTAVKEAEHENN